MALSPGAIELARRMAAATARANSPWLQPWGGSPSIYGSYNPTMLQGAGLPLRDPNLMVGQVLHQTPAGLQGVLGIPGTAAIADPYQAGPAPITPAQEATREAARQAARAPLGTPQRPSLFWEDPVSGEIRPTTRAVPTPSYAAEGYRIPRPTGAGRADVIAKAQPYVNPTQPIVRPGTALPPASSAALAAEEAYPQVAGLTTAARGGGTAAGAASRLSPAAALAQQSAATTAAARPGLMARLGGMGAMGRIGGGLGIGLGGQFLGGQIAGMSEDKPGFDWADVGQAIQSGSIGAALGFATAGPWGLLAGIPAGVLGAFQPGTPSVPDPMEGIQSLAQQGIVSDNLLAGIESEVATYKALGVPDEQIAATMASRLPALIEDERQSEAMLKYQAAASEIMGQRADQLSNENMLSFWREKALIDQYAANDPTLRALAEQNAMARLQNANFTANAAALRAQGDLVSQIYLQNDPLAVQAAQQNLTLNDAIGEAAALAGVG